VDAVASEVAALALRVVVAASLPVVAEAAAEAVDLARILALLRVKTRW
jgi:hypothetical protein